MLKEFSKKRFFSIFFLVVSILSLLIFLPLIRNYLIILAERYIGREINHLKWHSRMIRLEFWVFLVFLFIGLTIMNNQLQSMLKKHVLIPVREFKNNFCFDTYSQKILGLLFTLYIIGFSPIIRANFYYADDYRRAAFGVRSWDNFCRYVNDLMSPIIHGSKYLCDVSPLTHFISAFFLSVSSLIVIKLLKNTEDKKINILSLIAVIPLGINPYFLENLSYKFDCPYMALSILASIIPFVFYKKGYILFSLVSICGLLITDMTYQASSGVYPILTLIICFKLWTNKKEFKKLLLVSVISYLLAMFIFKIFLMHPSPEEYVSNKILLKNIVPNLKNYYSYVISDFKNIWLLLIVFLFVTFFISSILNSKQKILITAIVSISLILLSLLMSFGLYPVLEKPYFAPHAMYGFCIMISFFSVYSSFFVRNYLGKFCSTSLSWLFLSLFFVYGNVMIEQNRFVDFRINLIINDLNDIDSFNNNSIKNLKINGSLGYSPRVIPVLNQFNSLKRTVLVFSGDNIGGLYFWEYFDLRNISWNYENGGNNFTDLNTLNLPIIKDTMYHLIRGDGSNFIIELK